MNVHRAVHDVVPAIDVDVRRQRARSRRLSLPARVSRHVGIGAAIANAFFDATGVRIRAGAMTPARVRAVLKAAGAA